VAAWIIECTFDDAVSDGALIDELSAAARAEAVAAGRRFAAIAELTDRRCTCELALERQYWACDAWDGCAAELGAALMISPRAASTLMHQGLALCDRLPTVGALLAAGTITAAVATLLCWRTHLIEQPDVLDAVDTELAAAITGWGPLSAARLDTAVDAVIERHDPAAVLAYRAAARGRDVGVGKRDDTTGTVSLWGRLQGTDGALLTRRLETMATAVCRTDPRTLGERRSDALGVVMAGATMLPCRCAQPDCPHTGTDARAQAVVIHVLTDHHPEHPTRPGPGGSGPAGPSRPPTPDPAPDPAAAAPATSTPTGPSGAGTAVIAGGGIVPAPLLGELARMGAVIRPITDPAALGIEPGYRPSTRLARFIRARDLTCRQPGCHRPAEYCDLDHAIPYGRGPTHPANLRCLCRNTTCSKPSGPGPPAGTTTKPPTAPSSGPHPPDTSTAAHRAAACSSHTGTPPPPLHPSPRPAGHHHR
jgi:hypothetical protein